MSRHNCHHEDALLAFLIESPCAPLPAALQAHVARCGACRELHAVASAIGCDRVEALADVRVPSAGQVWWRAELRARHEAAARATRPITLAAGIAAACLLGLLASVAGALGWWVRDWMRDQPVTQVLMSPVAGSGAWTADALVRLGLGMLLGVSLLAATVAVVAALRDE